MRLFRVTQTFANRQLVDVRGEVKIQLGRMIRGQSTRGRKIGIPVGSRGIAQIDVIAKTCVDTLLEAGAHPFIIPGMGSHGGGTPEGQRKILASYGITEETMGVPIDASMDTVSIGECDGVTMWWSRAAFESDGVLLLGRVKPHTGFVSEQAESGLAKMNSIGLGKQRGASVLHSHAPRLGMARCIQLPLERTLELGKIWGAFGIVENAYHQPAIVRGLLPHEIVTEEAVLLAEAKAMMPTLPLAEIDGLFVRWMGKNISGTGIDPNVVALKSDGTFRRRDLPRQGQARIGVVMVTELTPESGGNAVGLGLADLMTARLAGSINHQATLLNAQTSHAMEIIAPPPSCDNDRAMIERAIELTGRTSATLRLVCIENTLNLATFYVSEPLLDETTQGGACVVSSTPMSLRFDSQSMLELSFD